MRRTAATLLAAATALFAFAGAARAESLVADLSEHLVAITSSFTGTEILVFGAVETSDEAPDRRRDIIVVVRGQPEPVTVRKKERIAGIWVNKDAADFAHVPTFYAVASTRALRDIADPLALEENEIGTRHLKLNPTDDSIDFFREEGRRKVQAEFERALVRNKMRQGLYAENQGGVTFLGDSLFRATITIPANISPGIYKAEVYLMRDGEIVSAQSTPLYIDKTGFERFIYRFATDQPVLYGFAAIALALAAGYAAAAAFRQT